MRVLHMISSEGCYGAENMLLNLIKGLAAAGCDSTLGVFGNTHRLHTEIAVRARQEGIDTCVLNCGGKVDFGALGLIREIAAAKRADVVHTHGYKSDIYSLLAMKGRLPLVATCHNWTAATRAVRAYEALDRRLLPFFDRVVAVSSPVAERLRAAGVRESTLELIANGIDRENFRTTPKRTAEHLTVGLVGRMVPEKGVQQFLEAARESLAHFPQTRFVLAGDGPAMSAMQAMAQDLGIAPHTNFLGQVSDMAAVYSTLDVLVLPSLNEGLPMCILEAMAAGVPVIATRVGDIPQLVEHERTGLLVNPGDVSELSACVRRLLGDHDLRIRLAESGRRRVEANYSAESMGRRYLNLYEQLLGRRLPCGSDRRNATAVAP